MPRVDANVVLRHITGEPEGQAERSSRFLETLDGREEHFLIEEVTVAEIVWTLLSFYRRERVDIAATLTKVLLDHSLHAIDKDCLLDALALFGRRNLDFADALLAAKARRSNDPVIYSFDHDFDGITGVIRTEP